MERRTILKAIIAAAVSPSSLLRSVKQTKTIRLFTHQKEALKTMEFDGKKSYMIINDRPMSIPVCFSYTIL